MSCNYADGLSPYENKGILGAEEKFDSKEEVAEKVSKLAEWISDSSHVVIHTGAGISTSAGIPDFRVSLVQWKGTIIQQLLCGDLPVRPLQCLLAALDLNKGPKGVWTLEAKGEKPDVNISFNDAMPTKTHMALAKLVQVSKVQYIVSQNIDGLHLRSGLPRKNLAELHGNMFIEQCALCNRQFVRSGATASVGQKCLLKPCPTSRLNGRPCRGRLHDTILDWEASLPENDLGMADFHSCVADLCICLGTTLQILPSGNLPLHTKKYNNGRLVICNLQPTKHDRKADLLIHAYVDDIMVQLMEQLGLEIPEYSRLNDPTLTRRLQEWTILDSEVAAMRQVYEKTCCRGKKKRPDKEKVSTKKIKRESKVKCEGKAVIDIKTEDQNFQKAEIKVEREEYDNNETG